MHHPPATRQVRSRGAAILAIVVCLTVILALYAAAVYGYVATQRRVVTSQIDLESAFEAAEAGIERAASYIELHHGLVGSPVTVTGSLSNGLPNTFAATLTPLGGYYFHLAATGTVYRSTWNSKSSSVSRAVSINRVWLQSWTQYALWSRVNGTIYFTSGEEFWGKVHADDKLWFQQDPMFHDEVSSLATTFGGSTNDVVFSNGFHLGTAAGSMADVPFDDLKDLATDTNVGILFPSNVWITFKGTNYIIATNLVTKSKSKTTTTWYQATNRIDKQLLYVQGDAYVSGTLDARLSIITDGSIHITNSIVYATSTNANDALGLISKNDVTVETNAQTVASPDVTIDAHIMATGGSFGAANYNTRMHGDLTVTGGIVQDTRGAVGLADGSHGFTKHYTFDTRFATNPPPYYPAQSQALNYDAWEDHAP